MMKKNLRNIEKRLYNFPDLCSEIRIRMKDHIDAVPIPIIQYDQPYVSPTNKVTSSVERLAFKERENDEQLEKLIDEFKEIKFALECLNRRQREVIHMYYWENMQHLYIGFELNPQVSSRTVRRIKRRALEKISEKLKLSAECPT